LDANDVLDNFVGWALSNALILIQVLTSWAGEAISLQWAFAEGALAEAGFAG
jgi:hypothetical protein